MSAAVESNYSKQRHEDWSLQQEVAQISMLMVIFKESCQIDHNDNILIFFFKRLMLSKIWVNNYFAHIFLTLRIEKQQ